MTTRYDVIVMGGGAAGCSAAVAAAEQGLSVLVIEKNPRLGGNGLFPMGIYGVNSPVQRRHLIFASTEEAFLSCMEFSHWKLNAKAVRALIEKSGDTIAWLEEMGVRFSGLIHHIPNQCPEVFHVSEGPENTGRAVIEALCRRMETLDVTQMTGAIGKQLIVRDGRVCGVQVEKDGESIDCEGDVVIVAAGGFGGNADMIAKYFPDYDPDNYLHMHGIRHDGSGINMSMEAGADVDQGFAMEMGAPKIVGYMPLNLLLGKPFAIWLNKEGERFTRESNVYNFSNCANACSRQTDGVVYVFLDSVLKDMVLQRGRDPLERITIPRDAESKLDETMDRAEADGLMCRAETLAEVAAFIGCAPETLSETLEEYNRSCRAGHDDYFAKSRDDLIPAERPPYYVIRAGVDMIATHGGIRVDAQFRALDRDRRPISGLYVAGVDVGGLDADVYNMTMSGHAFGFAVNSGRIAGENAARSVAQS